MAKSRFDLNVSGALDEELGQMARAQGITKAEAIERALIGYASLRRLVSPEAELILRRRGEGGEPDREQRVNVL